MQFDMFAESGGASDGLPPMITEEGEWMAPESIALIAALKTGRLSDGIAILGRLKVDVMIQVLLSAGFSVVSTQDKKLIMKSVQGQLLEAFQKKMDGHELRASREASLLLSTTVEKENNGIGSPIQQGEIPKPTRTTNRDDGRDISIDSEQMDVGLAEASVGIDARRELPGSSDKTDREGESRIVGSSEYDSSHAEGNSSGVRNSRGSSNVESAQRIIVDSAVVAASAHVKYTDYVVTDDDRIGLGGLVEKFKDNVNAIQILKNLKNEARHAVPDERKSLARYVGWGGLKGVFDPDNKQWAKQHVLLKELLTENEWAAASRSQLDAFYTPSTLVRPMYKAAQHLGFGSGRILDPSVGVGNFFGMMPEEMRSLSNLHGVELDILTSQIVAALYPTAKVAQATGFESYRIPSGYFDMVIGNPPFGNQVITDDSGAAYSGWSIHNYFFAKSIEMLRPGGIMPMVVSHYFLDKMDPHVRQWISRRAELVSAVRLPDSTFKENANTEVVTDLLLFRKFEENELLGERTSNADWLNTSEIEIENAKTGDVATTSINDYFIKNPQNVLGRQVAVSSMYRPNSYTVEASGDLSEMLDNWVQSLPTGKYVPLVRNLEEAEANSIVADLPEGVKEGSFYYQNGIVYHRLADAFGEHRAAVWTAPNQRAHERMVGMIGIRDVLRTQIKLERTGGFSEQEIELNRLRLNKAYDQYVKQFGFLNDSTNRRLFLDDTESALIQALEFDFEKAITPSKAEEYGIEVRPARATKADILKRRVLFPPTQIVNVESAKDALLHSLNAYGKVDLEYIQSIYNHSSEQILTELGELVFRDPVRGLVTADAYLSGDVKTKLAEANKAAESDHAYDRNVAALTVVIPKDKLPSEIFASIGAPWIPPNVYAEFAEKISGADAKFTYMASGAQWLKTNNSGVDFTRNNSEYGTEKMGALDILFASMNSRAIEVKKRISVDGKDQYVTDEEATEAVKQRADKVRSLWDSWLWEDGSRADKLTEIYNDKFNRTVERQFDGSHLSFPGMSPAIQLLKHQKNAVWRALQDRSMLADQVVGAGKTFELATIAMEMRRLGIAKKPLLAVPNHLTLQWRSDIYRLYPGANILAATPQDFDKDNREKFFSKIVTGNWDAVIVGHSSLKKLGLPANAEADILQEQYEELASAIEDIKRERGDRNIIRDMEKIKQNLKSKIEALSQKAGKKDKVVNFEDLGVDALMVDELHEFKNLFFTTQMSRVAGLGNPAGSAKAFDLFVKIRWLKNTYGENAPLITATGTPVSNSLAEMYTMQRFMQYESMQRLGTQHFDAWAKLYGDVQTVYEVAPSGTGYRLSQRFAKFKNLSSLMGSYRSFADVVTLEDLKAQEIAAGKTFPVPKIKTGKPQNIVAARSEIQEKFFGVPEIMKDDGGRPTFEINFIEESKITEDEKNGGWLIEAAGFYKRLPTKEDAEKALVTAATTPRMFIDPKSIVGQFENLRQLTRDTKGKINALSLTGLANKAGLDYRLINPNAQDFENSKINLAVRDMVETYHEWHQDKGVQLVFCDLSVPLSAKAKMANAEKRVYVRSESGDLTHKKGTLHVPKEFEGFPYYLIAEGKGKGKSFSMYDPVSGQIMRQGFDSKQDAHVYAASLLNQTDGPDRWLDIREKSLPIESDEIDEYKNGLALEEEGDSADFEISVQDLEGVASVAGFSVYDDIKAKLISLGIPEKEIEFIHDHDTPQAKDALFKRVNAGDVRFMLGSTPKMGAGTNVQQRLVALHHIDAPWRPSDLEQREGRIIRRGNLLYERDPLGFEVKINRYATAQTYDTRRWQLLEHKAAGVDQLRNYKGDNEIDDVASEAANSADMKAAASGNPLILKETQLSAEVKKLNALARAHRDSEYVIRGRMRNYAQYANETGPALVMDLKEMIVTRDSANCLAVVSGRKCFEKEDLAPWMARMSADLCALDAKRVMTYKGLEFEFRRDFESSIAMVTPDGQVTNMDSFSPTGVVTRMENWVQNIESRIESVEKRIISSGAEADSMSKLINKPFEHEETLKNAIAEHGQVQRDLMKANSIAAVKPDEKEAFEFALARQKATLIQFGYGKYLEGEEIVPGHKLEVDNSPPNNIPVVNTGLHIGRITEINSGYAIQSAGRGMLCCHAIDKLDQLPVAGHLLKIAYANGKGSVKDVQLETETSNSLGR